MPVRVTKRKSALTLGRYSVSGVAPVVPGGINRTVFALAPTVAFHPNSQSATLDGANKVTACPDLQSLAALSSSNGPVQMTDQQGRKFWRFNGAEWAAIANTLNALANRAIMSLAVVRTYHSQLSISYLNPRFATYTDASNNTGANASIGFIRAAISSASAPYLQAGNPLGSTNATDAYKIIPQCRLQVIAVASRTTANGGTRSYCNNDFCDTAQQTTSVTGYLGAIIGGTAGANNTENVTTNIGNVFDLYELAIWKGEVGNTDANTAVLQAVTNWKVAAVDSQVVFEGDSISFGIATTLPVSPANALGLGAQATHPGTTYIPENVRVLNNGTSGNQTSHLVTKRDAVNSIYSVGKFPGGPSKNKVVVQIGRNDVAQSGGQKNSAMLYTDLVSLVGGYLALGWSVAVVANIAGPNTAVTTNVDPPSEDTLQKRLEGIRAKIMTPVTFTPLAQFLTDTLSNTGQTYEGLVTVIPVSEITVGGNTAFKTAADAVNTGAGYYDSDNTHLRVAGVELMVSGGDTPSRGYQIAA